MTPVITDELAKLNEALASLAWGPRSEESSLVQEHLQGARTYLLGAIDREYRLHLKLALAAVQRIPDESLRRQINSVFIASGALNS